MPHFVPPGYGSINLGTSTTPNKQRPEYEYQSMNIEPAEYTNDPFPNQEVNGNTHEKIKSYLSKGMSRKEAVKQAMKESKGITKQEVYRHKYESERTRESPFHTQEQEQPYV
jgi:uncharacterized protein YoaH (UPF0181 family)